MIDHDINVTELSERVGISRPYVSGILNGRLIVPELAAKITKELDINEPYVY
jgi:plasmid maintenance system antidote protein VapI